MKRPRFFAYGGIAVLIAVAAGGAYVSLHSRQFPAAEYKTPQEAERFVRFEMEAFDAIEKNYWKKVSDADLAQLFQLSLQYSGAAASPATTTRSGVARLFAAAFAEASTTDEKKDLALRTLQTALSNLPPVGRSELLSSAGVTQLRQTVSNINPTNDLYRDLGTAKGANTAEVDAAYEKKKAVLSASSSPEAKVQLEQAAYAHTVLGNPANKALYDQTQIEPSVFGHIFGKTLYLSFDKISPTSLMEFARVVDTASSTPLENMIVDFRGNIGGDLAFTQGFLGLFVGQNQYAFDLFHQDDYQVQRTTAPKFDELSRFREIAVVVDAMTQSTAELTTAALKRFHLARVVGTTTRGWGSVENTYPLLSSIDASTTYALLLVNALTLRDDNQPIESHGVDPDISISDPNWKHALSAYILSPDLIAAIRNVVPNPPLR